MTDPYTDNSKPEIVDLAYERTIAAIKEEYAKQKVLGYKQKTIFLFLLSKYPKSLIKEALQKQ
jgi:hypothetical protein